MSRRGVWGSRGPPSVDLKDLGFSLEKMHMDKGRRVKEHTR